MAQKWLWDAERILILAWRYLNGFCLPSRQEKHRSDWSVENKWRMKLRAPSPICRACGEQPQGFERIFVPPVGRTNQVRAASEGSRESLSSGKTISALPSRYTSGAQYSASVRVPEGQPRPLTVVAERVGFEPTVGFSPTRPFQACLLNRSDTSPRLAQRFFRYALLRPAPPNFKPQAHNPYPASADLANRV